MGGRNSNILVLSANSATLPPLSPEPLAVKDELFELPFIDPLSVLALLQAVSESMLAAHNSVKAAVILLNFMVFLCLSCVGEISRKIKVRSRSCAPKNA